jgi:hypothetical protein
MINWLLSLPTVWLIVVVLAATYAVAGVICLAVMGLSSGDRLTVFSSLSPGLLSPLGVVFGLIVAFLASGIWTNANVAQTAVNTEASSMRAAVLLSDVFPAPTGREMRVLVSRQVDEDVKVEWPLMEKGTASIQSVPAPLHAALLLAFRLRPRGAGEIEAQRQLVTQIQNALDGRRDRIIVSHSQVNAVKWFGVVALGLLLLAAIACVHAAQPGTALLALGVFATAIALSVILILSQDRPFSGPFGIKPTPLEHIRQTS